MPEGQEPVTLSSLGVVAPEVLRWRATGPTLLMTIESAVGTLKWDAAADDVTIDRSRFLVVPDATEIEVRAPSSVASLACLRFNDPVIEKMVATYSKLGVDHDRLFAWLSKPSVLPRTVWIHEIVHRYVFERQALDEHQSEAARFLEVEILKEVYFLFRDRDEGADRATIQHQHSATVARAIEFIDAHLFEHRSVKDLARSAGTSESSLLRAFRKEVGSTPAAYWRMRKLDGALDLLRTGSLTVAEVAERVGYDNATAFGEAFRRRFGRPPSSFRPKAPVRQAP